MTVSHTIPRPEHPQPQMLRDNWRNLNGPWRFAFDFGKSGQNRKFYEVTATTPGPAPKPLATAENIFENQLTAPNQDPFDHEIIVPFCPESSLSGIGYTDFIPACWYQREIEITAEELALDEAGQRPTMRLHFGAVDYFCEVYVNGQSVGTHKGGYASFAFDIQDALVSGVNTITVYAEDDTRSGRQPRGKQSGNFYSGGCDYTRTTGIWQTVWLEIMAASHVEEVQYFPNVAQTSVTMAVKTTGAPTEELTVAVSYQGRPMAETTVAVTGNFTTLTLPLAEAHLWEVGAGRLYDVTFRYGADEVSSYFGLREVAMAGYKFLLNGQAVFQRTVLDQGFYPDGIYTAPTDEALQQDIQLALAAGFNGARLHEKAFEARFLYHADRAGYLVWGEMANWGLDLSQAANVYAFLPEWQELLARDFNHPAIVTWCPMNETWNYENRPQRNETLELVYRVTKQIDPTRPVIDTSGNYHVITDIYDIHDYCQDPAEFATHFDGEKWPNGVFRDEHDARQSYTKGQPINVSEYGGIKWDPASDPEKAWGYGDAPKTEAEFIARYQGLTDVLLDNPQIFGFCYTQLYDVEQERNGLYNYDRSEKFDMTLFKAINSRKAAIEE